MPKHIGQFSLCKNIAFLQFMILLTRQNASDTLLIYEKRTQLTSIRKATFGVPVNVMNQ